MPRFYLNGSGLSLDESMASAMDGGTRQGQWEYFSTTATGRRAAKEEDRVEPSLDAFWLTMGHEGCSSEVSPS